MRFAKIKRHAKREDEAVALLQLDAVILNAVSLTFAAPTTEMTQFGATSAPE